MLIKALCENGKKKLAKKLLTSNGENSFYYMMKHGATTLWENWDGCDSRNHPMFGAVTEFIVKYFNEALDSHHNSPEMKEILRLREKFGLKVTAERFSSIEHDEISEKDAEFLK